MRSSTMGLSGEDGHSPGKGRHAVDEGGLSGTDQAGDRADHHRPRVPAVCEVCGTGGCLAVALGAGAVILSMPAVAFADQDVSTVSGSPGR